MKNRNTISYLQSVICISLIQLAPIFGFAESEYPEHYFSQPTDFEAVAEYMNALNAGTFSNDSDLQMFFWTGEPKDSRISKLIEDYRSLFNRGYDSKLRKAWRDEYFSILKTLNPEYQANLLRHTGDSLFSLYPEKTYEQTKTLLATALRKAGLTALIPELENIHGVDKPQDCENVSLLNNAGAQKSLRITDQGNSGICYAHATVKALDYLNMSTNTTTEISSIITAASVFKKDKPSTQLDLDSGWSMEFAGAMRSIGGCKSLEWEKLPPAELEAKLAELNTAYNDFVTIYDKLKVIPLSPLPTNLTSKDRKQVEEVADGFLLMAELTKDFSPETIRIWNIALKRQASKFVSTSSRNNGIELLNAIITMTNELKTLLAENSRANAFGNFVLLKAFCEEDDKIAYAPSYQRTLLLNKLEPASYYYMSKNKLEEKYKPIKDGINQELKSSKAQPIVVSICAEILEDGKAPAGCSRHAVLLTGQKYDHRVKQCSYEILNSWGSKPYKYYVDYEEDLTKGTVWLPSTQIKSSVNEMFYLEPK